MKKLLAIPFAALLLLAACSDKEKAPEPKPEPSLWDGQSITEPEDLNTYTKTGTIRQASDLAWLSQYCNGLEQTNLEGWVITLATDIDLGDYEWTPIGQWGEKARFFKGTFDGAGHTIERLYIDMPDKVNVGLFGLAQGAVIKNLTVSGTIRGQKQVGGICGNVQQSSKVENCSFSGKIEASTYMGGICGWLETASEILNCHSSATIVYGGSNDLNLYTGGIVGAISQTKGVDCAIRNCSFSGKFEKGSDLVAKQAYFGGIVSKLNSSEISGCKNTADIATAGEKENNVFTGGIVGLLGEPECRVMGCYNTGAITNSGESYGYTGGIAGSQDNGTIICSYNTGVITPSAEEISAATPDTNFEICAWINPNGIFYEHDAIIDCYYTANRPSTPGAQRFTAEQWPKSGTDTGWDLGNDPETGKFWKNLGKPGTTNYPTLWWE